MNTRDLQLKNFVDAQAASDALSASAHNAVLSWKRADDRQAFVSQCNYCHQMGNSTTRAPRSHEAWMAAITKMEGYLAMVTRAPEDPHRERVREGLRRTAGEGNPGLWCNRRTRSRKNRGVAARRRFLVHPRHGRGRDGKFYGTDEGHDKLWVLDPGLRGRGNRSPAQRPAARRNLLRDAPRHRCVHRQPRSAQHGADQDGLIWITNALSSTLMSFDPATKKFQTYAVPGDALYPHTVRVGKDDTVWFTIVASNQMGHFDPKTGQMTVMRLPHNGIVRWITDMLFPTLLRISSWFPDKSLLLDFSHQRFFGYKVAAFPYGIDVNPKDGSIWYAKLYANRIGRIDPKTLRNHRVRDADEGPASPALRRRRHLLDTFVR